MRLSRDSWLGLGLIGLLVITMIAAGVQQSRGKTIPYLSTSPAPNGTLALKLWLPELGYVVSAESPAFYEPPADADIVLILNPILSLNEEEVKALNTWVEKGGTLILAGDSPLTFLSFEAYDFSAGLLSEPSGPLSPETPLLLSPPQVQAAPVKASYYLATDRTDFVTLLALEGHPITVSFEQGQGRVILSTAVYPFSNAGMKEKGNGALVLNLISAAVRRRTVWFDEWHHGLQGNNIVGPAQWLRRTPAGHALLFVTFAIFAALLLQGRGFGRPVPLPQEIRRRGPLEHVTAVANLNRKAGHRSAVLQQYHQRLKRHLGRRYRLDPSLPDAEYVRLLAGYNPALDQKELLELLARLSQKNTSEGELVSLAERASKWMQDR